MAPLTVPVQDSDVGNEPSYANVKLSAPGAMIPVSWPVVAL